MRSTALSIKPIFSRRRGEQGQAIVLIALLMLVLFGMLGLAIDSGRAYIDRRYLQDAVDAATLAAGDNYENFGDQTSAFNNALRLFQTNLGLSGGTSSISGNTMTATWNGGGYQYTITGANGQFNGYVFQATAQHTFPLTFFQVLGSSPTIPVQAQASAIVGNQFSQPALLTLSTSCTSLNLSGNTAVTVRGDVYSDGCITFNGSASMGVAGNTYAASGSVPSGITPLCYNPDPTIPPQPQPCPAGWSLGSKIGNAAVIPAPPYQGGNLSYYPAVNPGQVSHTGWTELQPGKYNNFSLTGGAGCYFFDAGIYQWSGGYTSHGGLSSNELKPPDEPAWNYSSNSIDFTQRANPQFWDPKGCAGTFALNSSGTGNLPASSNFAVELTSTRTDAYPPSGSSGSTSYTRESAPSMCRVFSPTGSQKAFDIDAGTSQQVPGATGYNVYVAQIANNNTNCAGIAQTSFGYLGSFTESQHKFHVDNSVLPNGSGSWVLGARSASQCSNAGNLTKGCAPPDSEVGSVCFITCTAGSSNGLAEENASSRLQPQGDLANENLCSPQSTNAAAPCAAAQVTPGAVQFYFSGNGDCINENGNGNTFVFSGYQYDWIVIYEPTSNNSCGNQMNGGSSTQYIGSVYTPTSSWTINGGNRAPLAGQVIAYSATLNGNSTIGINFNPAYAPAPPAARLVQ